MGDSFLNQSLTSVQAVNLTSLSMQETMVKVDKRLILHLTVAAIASTVKSIILCTQLDLVFGAVLAN